MRYTLLESEAPSERRTAGTVVSVLLHSGVIALAIVSTARATTRPHDEPAPTPVIYTAPPRPAPAHPMPATGATPSGVTTVAPIRPPVIAPVAIPQGLPPIDPKSSLTNAALFDGKAPSLGSGVAGTDGSLGGPADGVWTATMVEKAVVPRHDNPTPRYPDALRAARVEGSVVARFVVDSTGRVEPGSVSIVDATHPLFADAVRGALARSRYLPAEVGGRRVRQLVEQRFAFELAP